jgi:hypothetical protein
MLAQLSQTGHLIELQVEDLTRIWTQVGDAIHHVVIHTRAQETHFLYEYGMEMTH